MVKLVKFFPGENFGLPILSSLHDSFIDLASCPGSRGGGEREPGTHRSRMRLIISNFCRFLRHQRLPTAMIRNNIKGTVSRYKGIFSNGSRMGIPNNVWATLFVTSRMLASPD